MFRTFPVPALAGVALLLVISASPATGGESRSDLTAQLGAVFPDGSLDRYSDTGFALSGRFSWQPATGYLGAWGDVGYALFSSDVRQVRIPIEGGGGLEIPVEQTTTAAGLNAHLGLILSPDSRRSFFRPRLGGGIGLYNLSTDVSWRVEGSDETLATTTLADDWGWGWRVVAGAGFYVSPEWGVSVDYLYDSVNSLDKTEGARIDRSASSFRSVMVGVTFAPGSLGTPGEAGERHLFP